MISEAQVETDRSGAYLRQLCEHVREAAQAHSRMRATVECSDDRGVISFGWGRCTLRAGSGLLTLTAEAPDEQTLRQIERRVGNRLRRLGKADHLAVTWGPLRSPRDADPLPYPDAGEDVGVGLDRESTGGPSRWGTVILITAGVLFLLVVIVMHLLGSGLRGLHG